MLRRHGLSVGVWSEGDCGSCGDCLRVHGAYGRNGDSGGCSGLHGVAGVTGPPKAPHQQANCEAERCVKLLEHAYEMSSRNSNIMTDTQLEELGFESLWSYAHACNTLN